MQKPSTSVLFLYCAIAIFGLTFGFFIGFVSDVGVLDQILAVFRHLSENLGQIH